MYCQCLTLLYKTAKKQGRYVEIIWIRMEDSRNMAEYCYDESVESSSHIIRNVDLDAYWETRNYE